ncbi:MAG: TetR/AcrR family transcriptional regulator [Rhodothermia bacterium]|nr:TetR/AcrR family transcriptional regulator [Rhodothermia bacterium]
MSNHSESEKSLRRLILDSARKVVVEEGYAALTMRRLAKMIGYSATSIYLHFESKDALLHALIEEGMDLLHARLTEAVARAESDADAVRMVCREYVDFGLDNPEYYEVMFMLHPQRMERFPAGKYRRARRNLDVIGQAIRSASGSDGDADGPSLVKASAVWAQLHGAISLVIAQRVDASLDRDEFFNRIIDGTLSGLKLNAEAEAQR